MKIKQIPEDFNVIEVNDIESFEKKDENRGDYYYFYLTKKNYAQIRAIEKVARAFNTSRKLVHFAGTKDKVGITKQAISVFGIKKSNFEKNLEYFNSREEDLQLEFIGIFKGRLNLSDNLGNYFEIVVRDLSEEEINNAREKSKILEREGVFNFFDSQRFGYAKNSHIIGRHILKNEIELAVYEILTSLPENPAEEMISYVNFIKSNWDKIKDSDEETINKVIEITPKKVMENLSIFYHLKKSKNDFPGAFRTIHKKIRTLYINAYQSYIFNEILIKSDLKYLKKTDEIELISENSEYESPAKEIVLEILEKDKVELEDFKFKSMPELKNPNLAMRKTKIYPKKINICETEEDELNTDKKKVKICFELESGSYATNVIKQLF